MTVCVRVCGLVGDSLDVCGVGCVCGVFICGGGEDYGGEQSTSAEIEPHLLINHSILSY